MLLTEHFVGTLWERSQKLSPFRSQCQPTLSCGSTELCQHSQIDPRGEAVPVLSRSMPEVPSGSRAATTGLRHQRETQYLYE